jgi:WD40 repeat protein
VDNTARVWETASGGPLVTLEGHQKELTTAVFSPDGARVLTASWDQTARLWEAASGKLLVTLEGHRGWVESAVFSPDGAGVLTASRDKTARLWRVFATTQAIVNHAKAIVPRCLTPEQRQRLHLTPSPPSWCRSRQLWPYDAASLAAVQP